MDCTEEQTVTKESDGTCRHYTNAFSKCQADSSKSEHCSENALVNDEIQKLIPQDSFFHMISMPKNWEQVQRLKNRKHELDQNIFSRNLTVSEKTNEFEESKDSGDEIIDVENISVHDMNTNCSPKSCGDYSDAESDDSMVRLEIVEVQETSPSQLKGTQDSVEDNQETTSSQVKGSQYSVEDESPDMQETTLSQVKGTGSQDSVEVKTDGKSGNADQSCVFEDKASDLCKITAAGINNSLFDTIACLQQSMEPNSMEKQSSLEYIVSRIKSEAENENKETVYQIPNPMTGDLHTDGDSGKSERETEICLDADLDNPSVNTTTESNEMVPKKKRRMSKNLGEKGSHRCDGKDLADLKGPSEADDDADSGIKCMSLFDDHTKTNEKFPVKLKIKKYLKMQQKLAKIKEGQLQNVEKEVALAQDGSTENTTKSVRKNNSERNINEKGTNREHVQDSLNVAGKNIKKTLENSQTSDDLSLYKLKYECIQNQMKLLEYESKLLGLKEKLLEKKSMQHYFKKLVDKCYYKNQSAQINGGILIDKWDSLKKAKSPLVESETKCTENRPKSFCSEHDLNISAPHENVKDKAALTDKDSIVSNNAKQRPEDMEINYSSSMKKKEDTQRQTEKAFNLKNVACERKLPGKPLLKQSEKSFADIRTQVSGTIDRSYTGLTVAPATSQGTKQSEKTVAAIRTQIGTIDRRYTGLTVAPASSQGTKQSEKPLADIRTQIGTIDRRYTGLTVAPATSQETKSPFVSGVPPSHTPLNSTHLNNQGSQRGYQIQRPSVAYSSPGNLSVRPAAVGYAPISVITSTASTPGTAPPLQIVQVPPTGRLYAVVNNVLQPIVQNINGQYLPVINSILPSRSLPSGPKGFSAQSQGLLPCSATDPKSKAPWLILPSSAAYFQTPQQSLLSNCQLRNTALTTVSYTKPLIHSHMSENDIGTAKRQESGMAYLSQTPINSLTGDNIESNPRTVGKSAGISHMSGQNSSGITLNQRITPNSTVLARSVENKYSDGIAMTRITEKPSLRIGHQFLQNTDTSADYLTSAKTVPYSTSVDKESNAACSTPEASFRVNSAPTCLSDPANKQTGEILRLPISRALDTNYKLAHQYDNTQKACHNRSNMTEKSTKRKSSRLETTTKENSPSLISVKQEVECEQLDLSKSPVLGKKGSCKYMKDQLGKNQRSSPVTSPVHTDSDDSFDSIDWNRYESTCTDLTSVRSDSAEKSGKGSHEKKKTATSQSRDKEAEQEASVGKTHTSSLPGVSNPAFRKNTSQKCVAVPTPKASGKCPKKRYVKTKFIILKGDICDRWLTIKNQTGYEGMSDPSFVHYLLKLEEMRQTQLARMRKYLNKNMPMFSKASENSCNDKDHDCMCYVPVTECSQSSQRMEVHDVESVDRSTSPQETTSSVHRKQSVETATSEGKRDNLVKTVGNKDVASKRCSVKRKIDLDSDSAGKASDKRGRFEFLSNSTKRQMSWAVSVFIEWLKECGEECPSVSSKDACWIDEKLKLFYVQAKTLSGSPYPSTILQTFRRALSLWLSMYSSGTSIKVGISLDAAYKSSNKLLSAIMRTEDESSNSIQPVSMTDLDKLYSTQTFSDQSPENLLWKVWFDIVRHLCKPKMPKNFMVYLNKQNLSLESDVDGVYFCFEGLGYLPDCEIGRMYATPSEPEKCPVRTTSLYLSRLNENCSSLFQCPNKDVSSLSQPWYMAIPIGNDQLISLMERISSHCGLSTVYTIANVMATSK